MKTPKKPLVIDGQTFVPVEDAEALENARKCESFRKHQMATNVGFTKDIVENTIDIQKLQKRVHYLEVMNTVLLVIIGLVALLGLEGVC